MLWVQKTALPIHYTMYRLAIGLETGGVAGVREAIEVLECEMGSGNASSAHTSRDDFP